MLLSEAKSAFLYKLRKKNRPETTIGTYDKILRQFIGVVGNKDVSSLSMKDVDLFEDFLFKRDCVVKTRRNKLACVRSLVRYLYIEDLTTIKPERIELPEIRHVEANFLTKEEARRFVSVIKDVRDRAMMLCFLTTWVRVTELLNIQLDDLHARSIIVRSGKGGQPRVVFINEEAEQAIALYLKLRGDEPGPLFLNKYGHKFTDGRAIRKSICKYAQEAGIRKRMSPHTLRHTGATGFLTDGGNLEVAQKILGHTSIRTTMIYLHFTNEYLKQNYEKVTPAMRYT